MLHSQKVNCCRVFKYWFGVWDQVSHS